MEVPRCPEDRIPLTELHKRTHFRRHFKDVVVHEDRAYDDGFCPDCDDAAGSRHGHLAIFDNGCHCWKCWGQWTPYLWLTKVEHLTQADAFTIIYALVDAEEDPEAINQRQRERQRPTVSDDLQSQFISYASAAHHNLTTETTTWWHDRAVSDRAIDTWMLGEWKGWYTIPCVSPKGDWFAVKKRWKDAVPPEGMDRYTAVTGSRTRIAPVVFGDPTVQDICVIVPGEIKALALWSLLMERNIPWAVATSAGGENFWDEHWPSMLNFVSVAIWPDRDAKGMAFVSLIHDAHLSRAIPVVPDDHTDTKGIDDYILAGGDPVPAIARALKLRRWAI